mmetsp:Transcript_1316/g.3105  ORF Transcript_1316/g.3105 Transcript_1316/m.3105 type:complete len:206 (-) Transcript_1316:94-711(-)
MPPTSSRTIMISTPDTTSRFKVDASASWGNTWAGRRFAKAFSPERRPRSPRSGRSSGGMVSHLYPPMAESSTASEALHIVMVSSGRGTPVASMAAPPMSASWNSRLCPSALTAALRTFTATSVISGPMPSPGSRVIFLVARQASAARPGACCPLGSPIPRGVCLGRIADIVDATEAIPGPPTALGASHYLMQIRITTSVTVAARK